MGVCYFGSYSANIKGNKDNMKIKNNLKGVLYFVSILWMVWLITKSFETECFSLVDSYGTAFTLLGSMIINDLM